MRYTLAAAALCTISLAAGAQSSGKAWVKVTTRDTTGAPIPNAEVTIRSGLKDLVAQGTTDEHGQGMLLVDIKDSSDFSLTMRRIGYTRGDRFFAVGPHDTAVVTVVSKPTAASNTLATVKVTAKAVKDPRYESYDLYADDIENADGYFDDSWEMLKRLRPVMMTSRGGCGTGAQEIWVNGKRIRLPLRPTAIVAARARVGLPNRARFSYVPVSVLSEIAPEHIEEIHYHDCFDSSMAAVGNNNAIFVTLKPGIVYQQDVGSFVISPAEEAKIAAKDRK